LILGKGEPLIGRLLLVDALNMRFRELKLRKNPECPVCGENPTVTELIDYQHFCGIVPETPATSEGRIVKNGIPQITVKELKARIDAGENVQLIDVREPYEYQIAQIGGKLIPQNDVPTVWPKSTATAKSSSTAAAAPAHSASPSSLCRPATPKSSTSPAAS